MVTLLPLRRIASASQVPKVVSLCGSRVRGEQWRLGRREEGMNVLIENLLGPVLQGYQQISRPGCIMVWIGFNSFSFSKG